MSITQVINILVPLVLTDLYRDVKYRKTHNIIFVTLRNHKNFGFIRSRYYIKYTKNESLIGSYVIRGLRHRGIALISIK